ncbi:MAG: CinA family protein, partial [Alphaproteobacteria bacterium]
MTREPEITALAELVLSEARAKGLRIATAESCTGGLVSVALTDIPGSSDVFERGCFTYSHEAKPERLGVPADVLGTNGAVASGAAGERAGGALA